MQKHFRFSFILTLYLSVLFSACAPLAPSPETYDTLYQVSTLDSLTAGNYDGIITDKELLSKGNFGLGTFDKLDGEMLVLDGKVYQVKASGKVETPPDSIMTPFSAVTYFENDISQDVAQVQDFDALKAMIDQMIIKKDRFYAIRVDGTFAKIKTRSVPPQEKPYPILSEVTKNQSVFNFENVKGSVIGFWCPSNIGTINAQGYHLHFISDDRNQGGHLLDISFDKATINLDETRFFELEIGEAAQQDGGIEDRQAEIDKVEK